MRRLYLMCEKADFPHVRHCVSEILLVILNEHDPVPLSRSSVKWEVG